MSEDLAEIYYDDILKRTPLAILFLIERAEGGQPAVYRWIPKAKISDYEDGPLDNDEVNTGPGSVLIPQYLAEEKGLV